MVNFIGTFLFMSTLLALLAIGILLFINKEVSHVKRVLTLLLVVVTLMNINSLLYHTKVYLYLPVLHKILHPSSLLLAPISYIYIRSVLLHDYGFRKYDWLLLIPAILFGLNLLPYYMMPFAEKKAFLVEYYQNAALRSTNANGILPSYFFPFIRFAWSLIFIVLNTLLYRQFVKNATPETIENNNSTLRWIKTLNIMLSSLLMVSLLPAVAAPIFKTDYNIPDIAAGCFAFIICITLFVWPKILYGVYLPISHTVNNAFLLNQATSNNSKKVAEVVNIIDNVEKNDNATKIQPTVSINQVEAEKYKLLIEHFFNTQKPFLKNNYTLEQLVIDLQIPRYSLSAFINREYNMGFREFLNRYRVTYMIENINAAAWANYTLEAIAEECGFISRTTFIKNFKEITGETPSAYFKLKRKVAKQ